ncbi:glycosyltransferase family 2 protein [Candidatus Pacearchaeota archaeon]|nr:MAG: glycosyltransferase family 2 protein [Candidatus Pacearchaeota archaeon]
MHIVKKMDLSIVIPTYNEKDNIKNIVQKVLSEFKKNKIKGELIIVDDNSPDGTGKILDNLKKSEKRLIVIKRKAKLGLSSAVLDGWKVARGNVLGVMDADLSHPPEKIIELYNPLKKGDANIAIGSRYIPGGKIIGWGIKRKMMSRVATLLSRVFTEVRDPMSGFFLVKKECIKNAGLNPRGFKILLEVLIKCKSLKIKEVPITFTNRIRGKSKAGIGEVLSLLKNLAGYLKYKKTVINEFVKFGIVGTTGAIINLSILYLLTEKLGLYYILSAIISFLVAMSSNFFLNKIWTFKEKIKIQIKKKYLKFGVVSTFSLLVNLTFLYIFTEVFGIYYLISQAIAIAIAWLLNFIGNKIWTFQNN